MEGLLIGLTAELFTGETEVLCVEAGGPPFFPKEACPLPAPVLPDFLRNGLTPELIAELFKVSAGGGLQSGGGMGVLGVAGVMCCDFFPLDEMADTGGGDKAGTAGEA